jgi:hypothetical protein
MEADRGITGHAVLEEGGGPQRGQTTHEGIWEKGEGTAGWEGAIGNPLRAAKRRKKGGGKGKEGGKEDKLQAPRRSSRWWREWWLGRVGERGEDIVERLEQQSARIRVRKLRREIRALGEE